jgi:hypothetical protein
VHFHFLLLCATACAPQQPATGLVALQKTETWNKARKVYFHAAKSPARFDKSDGIRGEAVDVRLYRCPRPDLVVVTYGETWFNTTGWDVHVVLMRTNDVPTYPGNLYICPNGSHFAVDWMNDNTLVIYYPSGCYPDERDYKSGRSSKSSTFEYEKKIGDINVKFIGTDKSTMEVKDEAMNAKVIKLTN